MEKANESPAITSPHLGSNAANHRPRLFEGRSFQGLPAGDLDDGQLMKPRNALIRVVQPLCSSIVGSVLTRINYHPRIDLWACSSDDLVCDISCMIPTKSHLAPACAELKLAV